MSGGRIGKNTPAMVDPCKGKEICDPGAVDDGVLGEPGVVSPQYPGKGCVYPACSLDQQCTVLCRRLLPGTGIKQCHGLGGGAGLAEMAPKHHSLSRGHCPGYVKVEMIVFDHQLSYG